MNIFEIPANNQMLTLVNSSFITSNVGNAVVINKCITLQNKFCAICKDAISSFKNYHLLIFIFIAYIKVMDYVKTILEEAGFILNCEGEKNTLNQPQSLVIKELDNVFRNNENSEENKEMFMEGLKLLLEIDDLREKAFASSEFTKIINDDTGNITRNAIQQDSLVKMLLNTALQTEITNIILDEITTTVIDDEENVNITKLRMLLNSLTYLPFLLEPETLTTKLLDTLDVAPLAAQLEILNLIPEILPDNQNEEATKQLSKLLMSNVNIAGAIIDCLNALNLSNITRFEVQQHIVNNIITVRKSIEIFPILFEFLITDCKAENIEINLMKVRNVLDNIFCNTSENKETESMKVIIVQKIKSTSKVLKIVKEGWLAIISNINKDSDHKSIDLLLLFILHDIGLKQVTENMFKKRIKSKLFKLSLLENCFEKYFNTEILHGCLTSIIEIGHALLRCKKDYSLVEFATRIYKHTFLNKNASFIQRQSILQNLIQQTVNDPENMSHVLNVYREFLDDKTVLKRHHLKLLELLEKLEMFELKDVKTVFDILCSIIYFDNDGESMSGIQNELHILIRKYISSSNNFLKLRGIVCSVVMVKHIATVEDQSEIEVNSESMLDISHLPTESSRKAAELLDMTYLATMNSRVLRGLYYDELSLMLKNASSLDKYFLCWLLETVTKDFQGEFIIENIPGSIDGITLSSQYCINSAEEMESPININIADLSMSLTNAENSPIIVLAPIFRLLRLLNYMQYDGDLNSIDALLGCGIILPKIDIIDNFSVNQLRKVADCIFHCINWFREVISAFTTQKLKPMRQKVLKRLNHLIELEKLLYKCMEYIPEHKLPSSYFYNIVTQSNKLGSPKKLEAPKQRKRPRLNETEANEVTVTQLTVQQQAASSKKSKIEVKYIAFREIDIDTVRLLKYPLGGSTLVETPTTQQQSNLNLKQLNFLIKDFTVKLHNSLKGKTSAFLDASPSGLKKIIADCLNNLPVITRQLKTVVNSFNLILEEADEPTSDVLFTDDAMDLKIGFNTIMEMFSLIYSWSGFHQNENYDSLVACLKVCLYGTSSPNESISVNTLKKMFLTKLSEYEKNCLQLQTAVYLIETMRQVYSINENSDYKKIIQETSAKLLAKRWYNNLKTIETGRQAYTYLDVILGVYLENRTIDYMDDFVTKLETEVNLLQAKKDQLKLLPSIDKTSFHVLYRNVCHAVLNALKTEIQHLANNQHLSLWKTIGKILENLIEIVKRQESRSNFISFFKNTHGILKIFLNKGIPILEIMLKSNPNEVIEILKTMQIATRFLHNLCCHSKMIKDSALIKFVPYCKCTLETIIYRVKAALIANGCTSSFWMGNLKNKDLNGEVIMSQTTSNSEISEDTEEMLPDDDDDEELFADDNDTANEII